MSIEGTSAANGRELDRTQRELECRLTNAEFEARSDEMADAELEIDRLKESRRGLNGEISTLRTKRNKLATVVDSRVEVRMVDCAWIEDLASNSRRLVRQDTGAEVEVKALAGDERQRGLDFAHDDQPLLNDSDDDSSDPFSDDDSDPLDDDSDDDDSDDDDSDDDDDDSGLPAAVGVDVGEQRISLVPAAKHAKPSAARSVGNARAVPSSSNGKAAPKPSPSKPVGGGVKGKTKAAGKTKAKAKAKRNTRHLHA